MLPEDVLDMGIQCLGLLASAAGLGAIAGALLVSSGLRLPRDGRLALLQVDFALSTRYGLSVVLLFLIGLVMTLLATGARALLQVLTPREMMGRVMSLNTMAVIGMAPIGGFLLGPMAGALNVRVALAAAAAAMLVAVMARAVFRRALRDA